MKKPWLSVLIPTFNGEDYLASALDSIVTQGDPDIECIASDDGSSDSTLSILSSYSNKLSLTIIKHSHHHTWAANTNYALSHAGAEYACILHQDDFWSQNRLRIMKELTEKYSETDLFLAPCWLVGVEGNRLGLCHCPLPPVPALTSAGMLMERLLVQNFIAAPAPIFKRNTALSVGGLDETLWYTPDWDFWLKIASCGKKTVYYPKPLTAVRLHKKSQTVTQSANLEDFGKQLSVVLEKHVKLWQAPEQLKKTIWKTARFSVEVNTFLASMIHNQKTSLVKLLCDFLILGPSGWYRYLRDSRIWERSIARVRARL